MGSAVGGSRHEFKFRVPVSAVENPDKFLSERVVEFYRQAKRQSRLDRSDTSNPEWNSRAELCRGSIIPL